MLIHSPEHLALALNERRKQMNRSQAETGSKVGLKQNTVSNFELNPKGTKLDTLFRILAALNMEIHIIPKGQHNKGSEEW